MLDPTILMQTITCPKCSGLGYIVNGYIQEVDAQNEPVFNEDGTPKMIVDHEKNISCNFCSTAGRVIDSGIYDIITKYVELPKEKYLQISRDLTTYLLQKFSDCYDTGMRDAQPKEPETF